MGVAKTFYSIVTKRTKLFQYWEHYIPLFYCRDQNERSPLHLAALKGSTRCCEALLEKFDDCINWLDKNKVTKFYFLFSVPVILLTLTLLSMGPLVSLGRSFAH